MSDFLEHHTTLIGCECTVRRGEIRNYLAILVVTNISVFIFMKIVEGIVISKSNISAKGVD